MREKLEQSIEKLKAGDNSAFDFIYERTHLSVYYAVLYIVKDKMHAEDLLQETFVKAIRNLHQYEAGTNFAAWLRTIGKSLAYNFLKKNRRETPTDFDAESYKYGTYETQLPYIFDVAAKLLSETEYEILMLCQVSGYKRREVAAMLGLPVGTVTWKNNEALKKLKNHLQKEGGV